jgi:hypothetical protein
VTDSQERQQHTTDTPADLRVSREDFLRSFLQKGVQLAEDLVRENHSLLERVVKLEAENLHLRSRLASDDARGELLRDIDELRQERTSLLTRSDELERESRQLEGRYIQAEREIDDLASLYVASSQLSRASTPKVALRQILELLEQLVGAESVVLYVVQSSTRRLLPVASLGLGSARLEPLPLDEHPIGEACLTGVTRFRSELGDGSVDDPVAVVPLNLEQRGIAAVAILRLLPQKRAWASVDEGLFRLLSEHGARALLVAKLYGEHHEPEQALLELELHLHGKNRVEVDSQKELGAGDG